MLANSIYPEWFPVSHSATFEPSTAELSLRVVIPGPDAILAIKSYRYTKASDEITPVAATQKETKDRYLRAVHNITLRSLHEVFEADRRGLIASISLELGTDTISPATGQPTYVPFVAVAARREEFEALDLSAVVPPAATLEHLGASVSKNPYGLVPPSLAGCGARDDRVERQVQPSSRMAKATSGLDPASRLDSGPSWPEPPPQGGSCG